MVGLGGKVQAHNPDNVAIAWQGSSIDACPSSPALAHIMRATDMAKATELHGVLLPVK